MPAKGYQQSNFQKLRAREANLVHGHTNHDGRFTTEYNSWRGMVRRCTNPKAHNYRYYGGRGIAVDARWREFANFIADMGLKPSPKHTIERIDNDGDYEAANCRWATWKEQIANRRV